MRVRATSIRVDTLECIAMAGKRHHYLPQFLLRRFAIKEGEGAGLVWRADLSGVRLIPVAPKHEAAKRHYYRLPAEVGLPPDLAENVIAFVESHAASAISKFERRGNLAFEDRYWIALLLALQHKRTPAGRRELRFMDEMTARLQTELRLSDREAVRRALSAADDSPSEEEVEQWQKRLLAELASGEITFDSTPDREVGLIFIGIDTLAPILVEQFDWRFLDIPEDVGDVVLPDVGLTLFDPTPKFEESGTGFASSPTSETALYLSPRLVLLLRPGEGSGDRRTATARQIELLNLRAVACSEKCIYGTSNKLVTAVLEQAASEPDRVDSLRPRPPTIWIAESEGEPTAGDVEFVGYSREGTVRRQLYVSEEGIEEARRNAIPVA
jgi:uncharacterized protein DUF4238